MTKQKNANATREEKLFNYVGIAVIVLILVGVLAIVGVNLARNLPKYDVNDLYGCWYADDGKQCWRFSEGEGGQPYVYFFIREQTDLPYAMAAYTAYATHPKNGTVNVYYKEGVPTTFTCKIKGDSLTLTSSDSTLVFKKDIDIAEMNKLIYGSVGSPYTKEDLKASWHSVDKKSCWVIDGEGKVKIYTRQNESDPLTLKEEVSYLAGESDGTLKVNHQDKTVTYACTIREGKLILVADNARTLFEKGDAPE